MISQLKHNRRIYFGESCAYLILGGVIVLNFVQEKSQRGHPDLNRGPLDLQSNALPLSYTPTSAGGGLPAVYIP